MKELLEAGVHFGHQTRRWNPKMKRFIFTERGGIYIIDLQQTQQLVQDAHDFARNIAERKGTILFVGTKKQAQEAVRDEATRVGMPYVANRWLGGLLTNWRTIADRISYLHDLRRLKEDGQLELLPAKERITMESELEKLETNLGGVADMKRQPDAVFIVDLRKEQLAVREAQRLGLPVIALVDTNCDPDEAQFVIPGNDDAIRSCSLIVRAVAEGIAAGQSAVTEKEFAAAKEKAAAKEAERLAQEAKEAKEAKAAETAAEPAESAVEASTDPSPDAAETAAEPPEAVVEASTDPSPDAGEAAAAAPAGAGEGGRVTEISAAAVKELRELTGAGMMDCKRALQETGGDMDAARTLLREKGMASAGKRAGRATTEGLVQVAVSNGSGSIVGVGCETEPVSKSDEFRAFADAVLAAVASSGAEAVEELDGARLELMARLGENIVVVGAAHVEGGVVSAYVHPPAHKIGVLVQLERRERRARAPARDARLVRRAGVDDA